MKTTFTICALLFSLGFFAQEAGKVGELLKNEAKATEMQTEQTSRRPSKGATQATSSKRPKTNRPNPRPNTDYRWNFSNGNSEVFLRIPEDGRFTVEIGDQMISNASGKYRFFDLRSGSVAISIYDDYFLVYRTRILLRNNTRTVLDFFSDYGLYLLGNYPQANQSYGFNEWDDIWNNPYQNQGGNYNSNYNGNYDGQGHYGNQNQGNYGNQGNYDNQGNQNYYGNVMNDVEFNQMINAVKRDATFDNSKIAMIGNVAQHTSFKATQILDLVKIMSFENG